MQVIHTTCDILRYLLTAEYDEDVGKSDITSKTSLHN